MEYPKGIKWTKQRKCVYEILSEAKEPLSAHQIYHQALQKVSEDTYALSTIYRILAAFEENGLVSSTTWMGDDTIVYELEKGEHRHFAVCLECHKRIPLQSCPFSLGQKSHGQGACERESQGQDSHEHDGHEHDHMSEDAALKGFTVTGHKIELYGYCNNCQKQR